MDKRFKSIYLVCIEQDNDMNYVLARNPSLKKARHAAEKAKTEFPSRDIYITVEKVLKENSNTTYSGLGLGSGYAANLGSKKCVCGKKKGGCVSNLGCRCSAISLCKQMDTEGDNPFLMLTGGSQTEDELEEVEMSIVRVSRNLVEVLIPDWADNSIGLSANDFPRDVLRHLEKGVCVTAKINIDAENEDDLILKDIKLAYEDEGEAFDVYQPNYDEYDDDEDDYELEDGEEDYELEDDALYEENPYHYPTLNTQGQLPELEEQEEEISEEDSEISEE